MDTSSGIPLRAEIGQRNRWLLAELGLTQSAFAVAVGVSQTFVSGVSRGETLPSIALLIGLRAAFNVSLDWYLRGVGEPFTAAPQGWRPPGRPERTPLPKNVEDLVDALVDLEGQPDGAHRIQRVRDFVAGISGGARQRRA